MASDGFLGRWSRRKLGEDKAPEPALKDSAAPADAMAARAPGSVGPAPPAEGAKAIAPPLPGAAPTEERASTQTSLPTLQDIPALTPESDFKPFLSQGVEPQVRNAAMKKLFSDPRYNVMDRLDTYIDDYSQPDPIPESMLRKMVSAQFLGLFDEKKDEAVDPTEEQAADGAADAALADAASPQGLPADGAAAAQDQPSMETQSRHADSDLRLQPNHAPAAQEPGRGAG